jgi:hypothetical protein
MSYSSNPLLPKARAQAVRLVIENKLPLTVAARKSGIHRTTLWRWIRAWLVVNQHVQFTNHNRPNRAAGSKFRLAGCKWIVPTKSSRPHTFSRAIPTHVIERVQYYRTRYGRCATITHAYCLREGCHAPITLNTESRELCN